MTAITQSNPCTLAVTLISVLLFTFCSATYCETAQNADEASLAIASSNGISPSRLLVKLWTSPGIFGEMKHAALVRGRLYVVGMPQSMVAFDGTHGTRLWTYASKHLINARPTQFENTLYLVEGPDFVTVNADTGRELTRMPTRLGVVGPLFPGDTSWTIGSTNHRVYGLFTETGHPMWHVTLDGYVTHVAVRRQSLVFAQTDAGSLNAVSRARHTLEWRHRFAKPACSPLTLCEKTLFVGNEDYYLYSFNCETGATEMRVCLSAPVMQKPVVTTSHVFAKTTDGILHAVNRDTYAEEWTLDSADRVLTATKEHVLILKTVDGAHHVAIADLKSGTILSEASASRFKTFVATPNSGVVYAIAPNGEVLAFADRTAPSLAEKE